MGLDDPRFVPREELLALRPHPPEGLRLAGLWVVGDLCGLRRTTVAVVGSRAPSEAGRRRAADLARALAAAGVCVISGLALGIDAAAHEGALEAAKGRGRATESPAATGEAVGSTPDSGTARGLSGATPESQRCVGEAAAGLSFAGPGLSFAGPGLSFAGPGSTIGILGGGHRCFFPRRNVRLAEAIVAAGGAVVSPYSPDDPARPAQFLQRNGIVAGLADAVVVVEAAARSGALNTAGWAAARGIPVFAVPGDPDRVKAAGCNALIRDGAILVRDAADVLGDLGLQIALPGILPPDGVLGPRSGPQYPAAASAGASASGASTRAPGGSAPALLSGGAGSGGPLSGGAGSGGPLSGGAGSGGPLSGGAGSGGPLGGGAARSILAALEEPRSVDAIVEATGLEPGAVLAALVGLELAGAVERREDLAYARTAAPRAEGARGTAASARAGTVGRATRAKGTS
jgi:predicted Rossmann fold nucleotide-binding protein DprA/Smf involved in DNA uptake